MTTGERPAAAVPGLRATKQRAAVSKLLGEVNEFRSAQELHEQLRRSGEGIGLTTVYRTLRALADAGEIDVLRTDSGEAVYRLCSSHHHHHLVCTQCGSTIEIDGGPVEQWANEIATKYGFRLTGHDAEVFGLCNQCLASN